MRRAARRLAVLLGGLSLAGAGTLTAAGVAWSAGGRHHGRATRTQTTTTVVTTTTTTTTATTHAKGSNASKTKPQGKSSGKSTPAAKPKPKPKPKPVISLSAALLSAIAFPDRALALWTTPTKPLTAGQVHVSENGKPVSGPRLTPLSQLATGSFGVIVIVDESSSVDPTLRSRELSTAATIASQRSGSEQFGVVSDGATPTVMLPMTGDSQLIRDALNSPPVVGPGSSLISALALAYSQLRQSRVPVGAVVVVTAGQDLTSTAAEAAATQAGLSQGYQTFVADLRPTPAGSHSSSVAAQDKPLGTQLPGGSGVWSRLTGGYEVSYRSVARPKQNVTVAVRVDGVSGAPVMQYTAVAPRSTGLTAPSLQAFTQYPALSRYPSFNRLVPTAAPAPIRSSHSFWSSSTSIIAVAVVCALLVAVALALLLSGVRQSELETRVSRFIPQEEQPEELESLVLATPGAPAILARRRWWPKFVLEVDVARFQRSPVSLVKMAVAGSLVAAVMFTLMLGSVGGALLGLPLGPFVLYAAVRRVARKNRERFAEQLPSQLQDMAGAMRGGRSMGGAIEAASDGASEPALGEFERIVADEQLGRPLEVSLRSVAERMHSEDMEQVALVAALHKRSGSSVAEALDHVAEGARERLELIRELKSLTGQARLSSRILTALPPVMVVVLLLIAPTYMRPLLHTTGGIVVIVLAAFMVTLASLIMRKIVKVEA